MSRLAFHVAVSAVWLAAAAPLAAGDGGLRAACFAPVELTARDGEKLPHKRQYAFDKPAPARTLAPFTPVPQPLRGAIRRVSLPAGSPKLIALTFDMCEQPGEIAGYDGAIVDYLRANGIKATFFIGGKWLRSHSERSRQLISDPLFEVASHAEAHRNLRLLQKGALEEEIAGPQRAYEALREELHGSQCVAQHAALAARIPSRLSLFRFPYGACNAQALAAVNDAGLLAIQWNLSSGDPSPAQSPRAIARALLRATPGAIVVMHANGRGHHTAQALPMALPQLRAKGFKFVTVSELLAAGTPEVVASCYDSKPGDTDRYDMPFLAQHPVAKAARAK
jgi:peptidoglycan/xylan/chitin deacetylase (PgdA/CDA1 family)